MPTRPIEPPVGHVAIAGGGAAAWMTALLLAGSAFGERLRVTVLDFPTVDGIGDGEGTTPLLRGLFDSLGIDESEWMPACHATYKCGVALHGWSARPGFASHFQPFASALDKLTLPQFLRQVHARLCGADVPAHPDRFFMASRVAAEGRAPRPPREFPFELGYGYHADAARLAAFLRAQALQRGVAHVARALRSATLDERGDIRRLELEGGDSLAADFFIDCSGAEALLIGQALRTPWISYTDALINDSAIALRAPADAGPLRPRTLATGLGQGWAWQVPLAGDRDCGYVFSSAHAGPDAAETALRRHLGLLEADVPACHRRLRQGRHAAHWRGNCVAIGAAQGMLEPLQAGGLLLAQRAAASLVDVLERGDFGDAARAAFNRALDACADAARDFAVAHYRINGRSDTDYWRANAANGALSAPLHALLRTWTAGQPIAAGIEAGRFGAGDGVHAWYALLAGVGLFPALDTAARPPAGDLDGIDDLVRRGASNFPDQRSWLRDMPPHAERIALWRPPAGAGRRATLGAL